ncbi:MAG TPA: AMP-binding protein [Syntrophorhabdus sp.]|nr:AMP-binding protein [Syntrophorhabdus sp.]MDI9557256.1 AMP-binding protein [Pseudomonadota bacterium]OPX93029.1 MAG: Long-chain-fatty-acid--CoA ligase FadD13 [Syntrophorhabdus sp. PtaB.Bin027]OQB77530.1 MAG: Long-chain-fatty-acid--CoA ligase FadD13 [Deltaproteobacteria bacterium ADurb.Bin135]MBP8744015.1 AMP-binding protein [Syntrophorhabdus sp.]
MRYGRWMTAKDVLRVNAFKWPKKIGIKDLYKSYTFKEWDERACRLANALADMGMKKGDRFAVLAYNCVEWMEIYAAAAKGGFICVPLMFRLAPAEMEYNINHSECKVFIVQGGVDKADGKEFPWPKTVTEMKKNIPTVTGYMVFGHDNPKVDGFVSYEEALAKASPEEPATVVTADDPWVIMYTGGTTGKPKGVVKTHLSLFAQYFIMIFDHQFNFDDTNLLVMPCCHVNSLFYSFVATWVGGTVMTYNMVSFNPEDLIKTFAEHKVTFTSLVPTHYIMMLALPDDVKKKYDLSCVKKLLISSAPARRDTKLGVLKMFPNSELYEAYGSTEAGIVTVLKPNEQMTKLGSCGREVIGSDLIRFYDEDGKLVTEPNQVGELYSRSPMLFEEYWKDPEKTAETMKGEYFSAGDMGYRDEDGYVILVDRKANMIISGGENIFPSEVENCVGGNPKVKDVAVIGVPHEKWGEQVTAVIVLHEGQTATPEEITAFCKGKIAGFKVPKNIIFIKDEQMPRSGAGKILHRMLREQYGKWADHQ